VFGFSETTRSKEGTSFQPMATSSSSSTPQPGSAQTAARKRAGTRRSTTPRTRSTSRTTAGGARSTSTQPRGTVGQVQQLAERAVLVPVGAGLLAGDNLISTVRGLATRYSSSTSLGRELQRYERRGASARNQVERRLRRTRTRVERELRQRRTRFERSVRQSRRRLEREVSQARRDLEKRSSIVSNRVEKLVSEAQGLLG
jgi:hypothetical protein